jgi:hypothetical protein
MEVGGIVGTLDDEIEVDEEEDPRPSGGGDDGDQWRSQKLWTGGAGPKSFNHKITECSLFV